MFHLKKWLFNYKKVKKVLLIFSTIECNEILRTMMITLFYIK